LLFLGLVEVGGWQGLSERLPGAFLHVWQGMGSADTNPLGVNWITAVVALMFVMGPSYWCTDFLLVQRALSAKDLVSAQKTPLIAALPKMLFPGLVVIPGLVAASVVPQALEGNYNVALTELMARYFPPGMLGLGFTALVASFMSGMAGNVTAFNTVWTYDLCQTYLTKGREDGFYLRMGRAATIFGTAFSVGAAYIVLLFDNLMDYMQLIGTLFISPFFVVFLLGMLWRRVTPTGAFVGVIMGVAAGLSHHLLYYSGAIAYRTPMAATLQLAVWEGCVGAAVTLLVSWFTEPKPLAALDGLVYGQSGARESGLSRGVIVWAVSILALFVALNVVFA
jgi:SSS family solute:Na+ symporter